MDDKELAQVIERLDHEIPRDGAEIEFMQYCDGFVEHRVIANRAGYLRLGIEFLKAAIVPHFDKAHATTPYIINVDMDYLIKDSDIEFGRFERRETFEPTAIRAANEDPDTFQFKLMNLGCSLIWYGTGVLAIIGLYSVVKWLFKL